MLAGLESRGWGQLLTLDVQCQELTPAAPAASRDPSRSPFVCIRSGGGCVRLVPERRRQS